MTERNTTDALIVALDNCQMELAAIAETVRLVRQYHRPDIDWTLVGSFNHLLELLTEARQFIRGEEK